MKKVLCFICLILVGIMLSSLWLCMSHKSMSMKSIPSDLQHSLTILTYNTQAMNMATKTPENKVISYLQQTKADVLCLQEVLIKKNDNRHLSLSELKAAFPNYPYTYYDFKVYNKYRQFGNVVFSKYPLFNKHTIRYDSRSNITSCCDIAIQGDTLRLFINHLESNKIKEDLDTVLLTRSLTNSPLLEKLRSAGEIRLQQARIVSDSIQASPHPSVVVGDFNAIPLTRTYLTMRKGLNDCFLLSSNGQLGFTWVHKGIGLRIDYILASPQLTPVAFHIDHNKASDHYPCRATIVW